MHLIYDFEPGEAAPLARALLAVKDDATTGRPLGVRPAMAAEGLARPSATKYKQFLTTNLAHGRLSARGVHGPRRQGKPWAFLGGVIRDGNPLAVGQQSSAGLTPSIRFDIGGRNLVSAPAPPDPIFPRPADGHPSTARLVDRNATPDALQADVASRLLNPQRTSLLLNAQTDARHVDCVSCHTASSFTKALVDADPGASSPFVRQLSASGERFVPPAGTSADVAPDASQDGHWNVHNFGYSDIGTPSVSQRTANETALALRLANELLAR
jgi:hypothetical protein